MPGAVAPGSSVGWRGQRRRVRLRAGALALAAYAQAGTAACYREVPVGWRAAPSARDVAVTLDPAGAAALAAELGPRARTISGRVVGRTDSTLTVAVRVVTRTSGTEEDWPGNAVTLPGRAVERVTVRRLAALPSVALAGLAVVGAGVVVGAAGAGGGSASPGPGATPGSPR